MTARTALAIETSALLAIGLSEPDADRLLVAAAAVERRFVSAVALVESAIVLRSRFGPAGDDVLRDVLRRLGVTVVPVHTEIAMLARLAAVRYGKGATVPGVLNFGDTFSYALSVWLGVPLLFKGNDFSRTDVEVAAW